MTRNLLIWLSVVFALALPSRPSSASEEADFAAKAAQAFDQGDMAAATVAYERATAAGIVNGHLYYNLGVAYFRAGRLGDAMAAFLAARRYLPRDPDVAANLRFVLGAIHDKLDTEVAKSPVAKVAFWLNSFTIKEFAWATALLFGLVGIALTVVAVVPRMRPFRGLVGCGLLLPVACGFSLLAKSLDDEAWGAVNQAQAKVYSGPGSKHPVVFELTDGAPVLIKNVAAGGFYLIELSDGKKGWIPDSQVRVFGPL